MFNNPLVSVIIPTYNNVCFISDCILSVISQKYKNIEIIVIDDGSNDGTVEVVDSLRRVYNFIFLKNDKNRGVSYTRNQGILHASGEYLVFVDGDDWIDYTHVNYLIQNLCYYDCKIGFGVRHLADKCKSDNESCVYIKDSKKVLADIYRERIYMSCWNRIYNRLFLLENNIMFDEDIWYSEGMLFNARCLTKLEKVVVMTKQTYHYRNNSDSVMRKKYNIDNELCAIRSIYRQYQLIKTIKICKTLVRDLSYHLIKICYKILMKAEEERITNDQYRLVYRCCHHFAFKAASARGVTFPERLFFAKMYFPRIFIRVRFLRKK